MSKTRKPYHKKSNILIPGYPTYISNLLGNRGITTKEEADFYFNAGYDDLLDPLTAKGIPEAALLAKEEIEKNTLIAIFGDYDCDGITSTKVAEEGLTRCGAKVITRLPCRIKEGYGISLNAVKELIQKGVGLIITVDNGIKALDEIKYAIERGVKVIVLDHHTVGDTLPCANVVVDLHRKDETFGYKDLAGVGVAFLFIRALYKFCNIDDEECKKLLDLVAIGTVADCMPLTGENRIIVKEGLKLLNSKDYNRPGIAHIIRTNFLSGHVLASSIGFVIGPVLNAPGRLLQKGADNSLEVLSDNSEIAIAAASFAMDVNSERKYLQTEGVTAAKEYIKDNKLENDKVFVLNLPNQPEGIVGLISSRIKELYYKPTIVFTDGMNGILKGSARSIDDVNLLELITSCGGLFTRYGGHKQAAGMSIDLNNFALLREGINIYANDNLEENLFERDEYYEIEVTEDEITSSFMEKLAMLEPCGMGNPAPIVKVKEFTLVKQKLKNQSFGKFEVIGEDNIKLLGNNMTAMCWQMLKDYNELNNPNVLNIYGTLNYSYEYGIENVQISSNYFDIPPIETNFGKTDNDLLGQLSDLAALL